MTETEQASQYPPGWWIVALSREVHSQKPLGIKRFGKNLVFWRSEGNKVHALDDLCPHRSVKLSLGRVRDNCLECPFHGFRFSPDGNCALIPETGKPAPGIAVPSYAVEERDGYIWLWWPGSNGQTGRVGEPALFEEVTAQTMSWWDDAVDQGCHATRAIENQLDTAHLAFVHATTIGRGSNPKERKRVVAKEMEIKIELGNVPEAIPYIRLCLPNYWINVIHPRFMATIAFAPVDEGRVRLYMRTYQRFIVFPIIGRLITWVLNVVNRVILNQDTRVVESHPVGTAFAGLEMKEQLVGSDLAIREFRKWWANELQKASSKEE